MPEKIYVVGIPVGYPRIWVSPLINLYFSPFLGLSVRKMSSARFGHLLISRACDIIKFVGLKKIVSYGKVQAKSKFWQKTL